MKVPFDLATSTVGDALAAAIQRLQAAGIDEARLDARLLVAYVLGCTPEQVFSHPERQLDVNDCQKIDAIVTRRAKRQPLAQITGHREFWSLDFTITEDTLIPRPDSETLIEVVLDEYPERNVRLEILDMGTGSGCLLLALLHERPDCHGLGVDISQGAVVTAKGNAENLGLSKQATFRTADWEQGLAGSIEGRRFDVIICNPPYIADADAKSLAPEVAEFDPPKALFAGPDGLSAYRTIIPQLPEILRPDGGIFFEIGQGQADDVCGMMGEWGFRNIAKRKDLAGIERCIFGRL